jgi:hypothetical protein
MIMDVPGLPPPADSAQINLTRSGRRLTLSTPARLCFQNGGSARVYQEFLAPLAITAADGQTSGSTVYSCSAAVGANARFCRIRRASGRAGLCHRRPGPWLASSTGTLARR